MGIIFETWGIFMGYGFVILCAGLLTDIATNAFKYGR